MQMISPFVPLADAERLGKRGVDWEYESSTNMSEMQRRFTYHAPKPEQVRKYECIRQEALKFAELLGLECPASRELDEAVKHVESAVMWVNAGIARRS